MSTTEIRAVAKTALLPTLAHGPQSGVRTCMEGSAALSLVIGALRMHVVETVTVRYHVTEMWGRSSSFMACGQGVGKIMVDSP